MSDLLLDTVQMMASYTDVVVIRHPQPGAVGVSTAKPVVYEYISDMTHAADYAVYTGTYC